MTISNDGLELLQIALNIAYTDLMKWAIIEYQDDEAMLNMCVERCDAFKYIYRVIDNKLHNDIHTRERMAQSRKKLSDYYKKILTGLEDEDITNG